MYFSLSLYSLRIPLLLTLGILAVLSFPDLSSSYHCPFSCHDSPHQHVLHDFFFLALTRFYFLWMSKQKLQ